MATKVQKQSLSQELAKGHAVFGRVAPRRPYREDDDGGEGLPGLRFETHPLLAELPVGASSDLAFNIEEYRDAEEAVIERAAEASPELKKQPVLQNALRNNLSLNIKPSPV